MRGFENKQNAYISHLLRNLRVHVSVDRFEKVDTQKVKFISASPVGVPGRLYCILFILLFDRG